MILRRLSSEAWLSSRMYADHFINDRTYGSIGFIIIYVMVYHVNVLFFFVVFFFLFFFFGIYYAFVTERHKVE